MSLLNMVSLIFSDSNTLLFRCFSLCWSSNETGNPIVLHVGFERSSIESDALAEGSPLLLLLPVVHAASESSGDCSEQKKDFALSFQCGSSSVQFITLFQVLDRLEQSGVELYDQVCYRIVIQLCGDCEMPELAVKVLQVCLIFYFKNERCRQCNGLDSSKMP